MVGKEVTPKTISRHNQKTDLCNQKLFHAATKKRHNGTTGMVGKYHLKLFPPQPKNWHNSTTEQKVPPAHAQWVYLSLCNSVCLSVILCVSKA